MNNRFLGVICGIVSAITYGTNPLWGKLLYNTGFNPSSVLAYRFAFASLILAAIMGIFKISFRVSKKELCFLVLLGFLFAVSSLSLFQSFRFMDVGLACALLFVYPIMVALLMLGFFKEKSSIMTWCAIFLSLPGIGLLTKLGGDVHFTMIGFWLVMLSSLTYALYIVVVNKSIVATMGAIKLSFYAILFCCIFNLIFSSLIPDSEICRVTSMNQCLLILGISLFPTIAALMTMVVSVKYIGSTATSILGALEPVVAIVIGVCIFKEVFTMRYAIGIALILTSVMIIILSNAVRSNKKDV